MNLQIANLQKKYVGGEPTNFLLLPHVAADGDALGSSLALSIFLREHGHTAVVVTDEEVSDNLRFLPRQDQIVIWTPEVQNLCPSEYHVIILDAGEVQRLGSRQTLLYNSLSIDIIDHHQPVADNFNGDDNLKQKLDLRWIEAERSSTSEMIAELLLATDFMTKEIADLLIAGIYADTFGLRYAATTARTYYLMSLLAGHTTAMSKIAEQLFEQISLARQKVRGWCFYSTENWASNISFAAVDCHKFSELAADDTDTEGICSEMRQVQGIDLAILMREISPQNFKISLRSSEVFDSNEIARKLNGGGHKRAAGAKISGNYVEIVERLREIVLAENR